MEQRLIKEFLARFSESAEKIRIFFAPGRVNLIGEHTDYNGGYVFPAALTMGTYMVVRPRKDKMFYLGSTNFEQKVSFSLEELVYKEEDDWGNYPKGIIKELAALNVNLTGADILYHGTLPNGAGLSSSASIGMTTAYGLTELFNHSIKRVDLALAVQRMENTFIGVNSGIMDQFAVGFGEKDHALFLNCATLETEKVRLALPNYKIVITNTNKRRGLADSKYNERRDECEEGLKTAQTVYSSLQNLSELTVEMFNEIESKFESDIIKRRVRHIVTENERVVKAKEALNHSNLREFGELMKASHESLQFDYEVTGKELDVLFMLQRQVEGCVGTRMTGAGFGGCTVSIVREDAVKTFKDSVKEDYEKQTGLTPTFYICDIGDGVKELKGVIV
ncbi:galactokinase [Bacillus taeanensis]|uniref:Galactokinase n=1 Tax=Bacillus taeanensis TaxID=273032 RepID=A0A366Y4K8_9BACI|nr:galactokinase [Bacillus taeanensis]RBW71324.1 galactokinase [Bacillus taeanensis]